LPGAFWGEDKLVRLSFSLPLPLVSSLSLRLPVAVTLWSVVRRTHSGRSMPTPAAPAHGRNTRAPSQSSSLAETEEKRHRIQALGSVLICGVGPGLAPAWPSRPALRERRPYILNETLPRRSTFRRTAARFPTACEFSAVLLPSENTCHSSLPDCLPPLVHAGWTANYAAQPMVARQRGRTARTSSALNPPLALPPSETTPRF
jgi:hypothetical protein